MSVYQRISGRPFLCHINQCAIDRTVTVRVIFTHRITDDTCTLSVRLVGTVIQFDHRVQNSSLYRFQTISYIRQCTGRNNTHRVVDIRGFHCLFQIHFVDFVKYIVFHQSLRDVSISVPPFFYTLLLYIQVLDIFCIFNDELTSRFNFVTHQGGECKVQFTRCLIVHRYT